MLVGRSVGKTCDGRFIVTREVDREVGVLVDPYTHSYNVSYSDRKPHIVVMEMTWLIELYRISGML